MYMYLRRVCLRDVKVPLAKYMNRNNNEVKKKLLAGSYVEK
jgi:hypothetical protein